ncbi:MAG: hypothetical protein WB791_09230 [Waddliaceae bacterium]
MVSLEGASLNPRAAVDHTSVNAAAFFSLTGSSTVTIGSAYAATLVASNVAAVALVVLAITGGGVIGACITAWLRTGTGRVGDYFDNVRADSGVMIAAIYAFAAETIVVRIIEEGATRIAQNIGDRLFGKDRNR